MVVNIAGAHPLLFGAMPSGLRGASRPVTVAACQARGVRGSGTWSCCGLLARLGQALNGRCVESLVDFNFTGIETHENTSLQPKIVPINLAGLPRFFEAAEHDCAVPARPVTACAVLAPDITNVVLTREAIARRKAFVLAQACAVRVVEELFNELIQNRPDFFPLRLNLLSGCTGVVVMGAHLKRPCPSRWG